MSITPFRLLSRLFVTLAAVLVFAAQTQAQVEEPTEYLRFAVMALAPDAITRIVFEDELVAVLRQDNYDAVASHELLPNELPREQASVRRALLAQDVHAVLVLRPLSLGNEGSITAAQQAVSAQAYSSLTEFINDYRGHDFESQAVVHVMGVMLDDEQSRMFWQGVIWLDDTVDTQQEAIDKLVTLVQFNLNQSRPALRQVLGLPPLEAGQ